MIRMGHRFSRIRTLSTSGSPAQRLKGKPVAERCEQPGFTSSRSESHRHCAGRLLLCIAGIRTHTQSSVWNQWRPTPGRSRGGARRDPMVETRPSVACVATDSTSLLRTTNRPAHRPTRGSPTSRGKVTLECSCLASKMPVVRPDAT